MQKCLSPLGVGGGGRESITNYLNQFRITTCRIETHRQIEKNRQIHSIVLKAERRTNS